MQKNNNTCCVLFYDNHKYHEMAKLTHDSFVTFHKDEVDVYFITPDNIDQYPIETYKEYPDVIGIKKYIRGYDIMVKYGYEKLIILDVDTIACYRFDEFLDDNSDADVLATLNYALREGTDYWATPVIEVKMPDGRVEIDHINLNAGVICIKNPDALKKIIDLSIEHRTVYCEQSGINELAWVDKSYKVKAIESPYPLSKVVYNARSKGVPRAEMINAGHIQNCWPHNIHGLPKEWLEERGLVDGNLSPVHRWYIKDGKLFTEDHKHIKCFHFIEAMGMQDMEKFNRLINDFKTNWFNKETVEYFKTKCNVEFFFKKYDELNKDNKFKIIVPSYNNEAWVEYNVASVLNQTHKNYEVLYIDDNSTDDTYNKVLELVKDLPNWKVIKNKENKGATYNYIEHVDEFCTDDQDIIVHLDGDDWLIDSEVLEKLNRFYNEKDCWMTYGGFVCWDGSGSDVTLPYPQSTDHPKFIHDHKLYRQDQWRASHLRTFRAFLFKQIDNSDLISKIDGQYYWHGADLAWQYPCLEMCGESKIGVVNFYTCVYNQSKSNRERTQEREHSDNTKYEIEIRNKKKYVTGVPRQKMNQVNVFPIGYYPELYDIPTKFSYCYEQPTGEFDMTLLCDPAIKDYILGKFKVDTTKPVVARLLEHKGYFQNELHDLVLNNHDKFDLILTFDRVLLENLPNAKLLPPLFVTHFNCLPNPIGIPVCKSELVDTYELPDDVFQIYKKSKLVSAISSNKAFLPGHVKRLNFINSIKHRVDLYGRGMGVELASKLDGLRDYMFSIAIENVENDDYYFTEKITECFLTGTVPIYHGCLNIDKFFDTRGILYFKNQEELNQIMDSLTPEKYQEMMPYIKVNFEACFNWPVNNDSLYEKYYKKIIQNIEL